MKIKTMDITKLYNPNPSGRRTLAKITVKIKAPALWINVYVRFPAVPFIVWEVKLSFFMTNYQKEVI